MTMQVPQPPATAYRGDRYRLNFTAGVVLSLLCDAPGPMAATLLYDQIAAQNDQAGVPGGQAGSQWAPPPVKGKGSYSGGKNEIREHFKRMDDDDDDEVDLDAPLEIPQEEERWPDTIREYCTYFEPTHDRLSAVLRMLDYCHLIEFTGLDAGITSLGRQVVANMQAREAEERSIALAETRLTPAQQYLVGDARDTAASSYSIPFVVLPLSLTSAVRAAALEYEKAEPSFEDASLFDAAVDDGIARPDQVFDVTSGILQLDSELPIRRNLSRKPSFRQFLWIMYNDRNTFTLAYAGVTEENTRIVGSKSQLGNDESIKDQPHLIRIKKARSITKATRKFCELVLSGGPEAVWAGKPLNPKDVHTDTVAFVAADRPGFNDNTARGASIAWEMFDTLGLTMMDYESARASLKEGYGRGLVAENALPASAMIDAKQVADEAIAESADAPVSLETAEKFVQRTADKLLSDIGIDIEVNPVMSPSGVPFDIMCRHVVKYRLGDGTFRDHRCNGHSIGGSGYCEKHGGTYLDPEETESLVRASQQKIIAAGSKAVEVMIDIMLRSPNDAVRQRAAEQLLNRGALSESREININVDGGTSESRSPKDIVSERLNNLMSKPAEIEPKQPDAGETIDAEVVEDE